MALPTPIIETERLMLTTAALSDAEDVVELFSAPEASANTLTLPYPYSLADAHEFVERVRVGVEADVKITFVIRRRVDRVAVGTIGITIEPEHERAELGYIIGREHWGNGYATEACTLVIAYAFDTLGLHKVTAAWFTDNPASGRVLEKLGFENEGTVREQFFRDGRFRDSVNMGLIKQGYEHQHRSADAEETTK